MSTSTYVATYLHYSAPTARYGPMRPTCPSDTKAVSLTMSFLARHFIQTWCYLLYILCSTVVIALNCHHPFVPENGYVTFDVPAPYIPNTIAKYSLYHLFHFVNFSHRATLAILWLIDFAPSPITFKLKWLPVQVKIAINIGTASQMGSRTSNQCDISHYSFTENATVYLPCRVDDVTKVRIVSEFRLHLCTVKVFAVNAVSIWQCSQSTTMQVLGVFDGLCYSSSRDEKADWQRAQRKCLDRGATLPMKITEIARRGVRSALTTAGLHSDYYWIGASSSLTNWRWTDGSVVDEDEADWSTTAILPSIHPEAIVLARVVDWRWIPSTQKVWNSFLCQSKPKSCTFPGVDAAGRVSFTSQNLLIGTYAIYSCENGYEIDGLAERRCEESALWSGNIPKCRKRKCGHVEEWNGEGKIHLVNGSTEFGSEYARVERAVLIEPLFALEIETPRACTYLSGRFTFVMFVVSHGHLSVATIEYVCPNGWKLIGVERRRCQEDGSWSGSAPFCKVVDCGAPPTISNGRVFTLMTIFGSQANYSCLDGYRLIGHDIVTCGSKGIWEPAIPVCYGKFLGCKINL
ncbi:unnamed protein product [Angiostrongylus costaricensis]|uniref:Sushi, von Willebrand factor type A, EGF and pentraxin domain-containing protein 1 n=1 Tax=Angiostrongylus costaricensis TaxID=334426 RepID=A0A158PGV2_ANGCS|nr:unnamed protein product [Angiostrongylus costaricensis]